MQYTISTWNTGNGFMGYVRDGSEKIVAKTAEYDNRDDAYKAAKELRDRLRK